MCGRRPLSAAARWRPALLCGWCVVTNVGVMSALCASLAQRTTILELQSNLTVVLFAQHLCMERVVTMGALLLNLTICVIYLLKS